MLLDIDKILSTNEVLELRATAVDVALGAGRK